MSITTTPANPKSKPKARKTPATRKKSTKAKRAVDDALAKAAIDKAREEHKQSRAAEDGGIRLPQVKGPDVERSMDADGGGVYMSKEDLYHLLHLQSEYQRTEQEIALTSKDLQNAELAYLKKQLEVGKRRGAAQVAHAEARGKLQRLHQALERCYGINMSRITFDDETGLIGSRTDG